MNIDQLLSYCTHDDGIDIKLLTAMLFNEQDQKKIREHIKATS